MEAKVAAARPGTDWTAVRNNIEAVLAQTEALTVPPSLLKPHYELRGRLRLIHTDMELARKRLLRMQEHQASATPPAH